MKRTLAALFITATLAASARADASRHDLRLMPQPGVLRAGQVIELQWSAAPREVEELEIILSLDGGRTWRIRVSPELDADAGRYLWHVPDLPAERARLRIRAGDGRGGEWEGTPGETFRIVGSGRVGETERPLIERGWWFVRDEAAGGESEGLADESAPGLEAAIALGVAAPLPGPTALDAPPAQIGRAPVPPSAIGAGGGVRHPRATGPAVVPLRN